MGIKQFIDSAKTIIIQNEEKPMTIIVIFCMLFGVAFMYWLLYILQYIIFPLRVTLFAYGLYYLVIYFMPYIIPYAIFRILANIIKEKRRKLMYTKINYYPSQKSYNRFMRILSYSSFFFGFLIGIMLFNTLECKSINFKQDQCIITTNAILNNNKLTFENGNLISSKTKNIVNSGSQTLNEMNVLTLVVIFIYLMVMFVCMMSASGYLYTYAGINSFKKYKIKAKEIEDYSGYLIGSDKEHYIIKMENSCAIFLKKDEVIEIKCLEEEKYIDILTNKVIDINNLVEQYFSNNNISEAKLKDIHKYLRKESIYLRFSLIIFYFDCGAFFKHNLDLCIPKLKIETRKLLPKYYFKL
jgi:ABC-type multidrug transport system fused ATPase/permease subunit